jgi:ribosome-binding factor A
MALLTPTYTRRRWCARFACAMAAVLLGLAVFTAPVVAQKAASSNDLKAAFVFQFANYVQWPESAFKDADAPIVIGIAHNAQMSKALSAAVKDKTVGNRSVQVVDVADAASAATCHILFIDAADDTRVDEFLKGLAAKPVLTVSDDTNFTEEGGIIRLFERENKLRIEINVDEAGRAGLTISSKLLSLASVVHDKK